MKKVAAIIGMAGLLTGVAYGHGGHGAMDGASMLHYLVEPAHGLIVVAVIALALWLPRRRLATKQIRK